MSEMQPGIQTLPSWQVSNGARIGFPSISDFTATSWNGWNHSTGTCTLHTWNDSASEDEGDPPVGKNYDPKLRNVSAFDEFQETIRRLKASNDPRVAPRPHRFDESLLGPMYGL